MTRWRREKAPWRWSASGNRGIRARLPRLITTSGIGSCDRICGNIMFFNAGHAHAAFILYIHTLRLCIDEAIHRVLRTWMDPSVAVFIFRSVTSHARSTTRTSALSFVMSSESVTTGKSTPAFGANVWTLSGVKLRVSFQIMKSSKARLASLAHVRFLLTMCKKVAFEIMMPCEFRRTVGATVFFSRR